MRILIIRHAEPDYDHDSLTERGKIEANLLAERLVKMNISAAYCSTLGRAKETAAPTLKKIGLTAEYCSWLREFWPLILRPDRPRERSIVWDWTPAEWTCHEEFFSRKDWQNEAHMIEGNVAEAYTEVLENFDAVLAKHGYVRDGEFYRAEKPNRDTIAFFCHHGLGSILNARLLNVSPMITWNGTCLAPSSVSVFYTEERRSGIASFRAQTIGDTSHLYAGGLAPSFSARFCETFDSDERH